MAKKPPNSNMLPSNVETIKMTASEFKQYVGTVKSLSLRQKLMPIVRACEGPSSVNTGPRTEVKSRPLQPSQTFSARSFFMGQKKVVTTESQVSSTSSKESSQELALAQELKSAKASGINSTFIDGIQALESDCQSVQATNCSGQALCHGSKNDSNDIISSVNMPHHDPLDSQYPVKENLPAETTGTEFPQAQNTINAISDNIVLEDLQNKIQQENTELTEEGAVDKLNEGSTQAVNTLVVNIQVSQTVPQTASGSDREVISSQTSQQFFSATSATFNTEGDSSSDQVIDSSTGSIQAYVGSDDNEGSESEYSAPWGISNPSSPCTLPTETVSSSENMALLTEDLVPESDRVDSVMEGVQESVPESHEAECVATVAEAAATSMEVVVSDEDSEVDIGGESGISLVDASIVLMQRSKERSKEEISSEDNLSSDGY